MNYSALMSEDEFEVVAKSCLETHETPKSTAKKFIANGSIANDSIANDSIVDNTYHQPEQQEQQAADFQAEFMRLHSKGDAELPEKNGLNSKVEECVGTPTEEIEFHSQLDLESNLKTYVINNAAADNANNNQAVDLETFLSLGVPVESIKVGSNENKAKSTNEKSNRFTIGPQLFFINDILKIAIANTDKLDTDLKLYGQTFKKVMFYGMCTPLTVNYTTPGYGCEHQGERVTSHYKVEDGTAGIVVYCTHANLRRVSMSEIDELEHQYKIACKEGLPTLGYENSKPTSAACKDALEQLKILINVIKRNVQLNNKSQFQHGSKVCVIGRPILNPSDNTVRVIAYDMYEDNGINRDMEINLKACLIKLYRTKYLKYKITGELIQ